MRVQGATRIRLTVEEREWLVSLLYREVLWDLSTKHAAERSEVDAMLEDGPLGMRRTLIAQADLEAAHRLLDKLDWIGGHSYAEAHLMYECGVDLEPEKKT